MRVTSTVHKPLVALVALLALAACSSTQDPAVVKPSPSPTDPVTVTVAVYGPGSVVAAYRQIAARFASEHPTTKVVVTSYASHNAAMAGLRSATAKGHPPDLFLMDHEDLDGLARDQEIRRIDDLLAAREVDFGDGYSRSGLEAFSSEAALQCMPVDVSPLVVYFNPALIELDKVADPGRNPVDQKAGWALDEFARAALQARRPGIRGLYIAPDLEQVAPFIWSGGGDVVDDLKKPTTLTLSADPSVGALTQLLQIVRNPALTFSQAALRRKSALDRFKAGTLGMILGYRDLTPQLRAEPNLTFDVMPLPKLSKGASIARMSGLCISSRSQHASQAADLLAEVISDKGAGTLAATGYVMPSNLDVLNSEAFLQTGQRPLNSSEFARELRDTRLLPSTPAWPAVRRAAEGELARLFYQPAILPQLQTRLGTLDQASVPIFDPSKTPVPSPTSSPTG